MSTPEQVPSKQRRFLQGYSELINLGKKESSLMNDMCVFIKMGDEVCCIDKIKKTIYLLVKNKNCLFVKKQTLHLNGEKFK